MPQPNPRRQTTTTAIEARLRAFLATAAPSAIPSVSAANNESWEGRRELRFFKHLYLEGGVTVTRGNRIAIEAERLWISPIDDRLIVENGLVRYVSAAGQGRTVTYTVRGPRLVKQGTRLIGREVSVTSCPAGEPQFEIFTAKSRSSTAPPHKANPSSRSSAAATPWPWVGTSLLPFAQRSVLHQGPKRSAVEGWFCGLFQPRGLRGQPRLRRTRQRFGIGHS